MRVRSRVGMMFAASLAGLAGCGMPADQMVHKEAPDFTLENLDGDEVTLSKQRGKVVLLSFFGCG